MAVPLKGRVHSRQREENWTAWLMVLPALLIVGLFTLYPLGKAVWDSFWIKSPLLPTTFAGLKNYQSVAGSEYFVGAWKNTLIFTVVTTLLTTLMALAAAGILRQTFRGSRLLKPAVLLPWTVPAVISGVMWKWIFNSSWGALNAILYSLGLIKAYIPWLTDARLAFGAVCLAHSWSQLPFAAILILGALHTIPRAQYEAAEIDGAGAMHKFLYVTLPNIRTILVIVLLYETLMGLTAYDITYSMTAGGPGTSTTLISYFTWAETFKMMNFGNGTALAVMIALVSVVFILGIIRALPKGAFTEEG